MTIETNDSTEARFFSGGDRMTDRLKKLSKQPLSDHLGDMLEVIESVKPPARYHKLSDSERLRLNELVLKYLMQQLTQKVIQNRAMFIPDRMASTTEAIEITLELQGDILMEIADTYRINLLDASMMDVIAFELCLDHLYQSLGSIPFSRNLIYRSEQRGFMIILPVTPIDFAQRLNELHKKMLQLEQAAQERDRYDNDMKKVQLQMDAVIKHLKEQAIGADVVDKMNKVFDHVMGLSESAIKLESMMMDLKSFKQPKVRKSRTAKPKDDLTTGAAE